jgi:hypothetical protein
VSDRLGREAIVLMLSSLLTVAGCMAKTADDSAGPWLTIDAAAQKSQRMKARGMRPSTVDCGLDWSDPVLKRHLIRITWVPNRPRVGWMLSIGGTVYVGERALWAKRTGAKKVSSSFYAGDYATYGRTQICTIWYAPASE